ncbi:hypothetical protein AB0I81_39890 [Nonomuraea sp. NPDC050404]|uniref:hypothetical protein n=1 Tax=Nonomuraea sp. NPDC050404 TaxID=3155783 RepID=UPI0033F11854
MSPTNRGRSLTERQRTAWRQLGKLLTARRAEIDPRYVNRKKFCEERRVTYKVIQDIEGARRTNFSPEMLAALEAAYDLEPDAITEATEAGPVESLRTRIRFSEISTPDGTLLVPDVPANMTEEEKAVVRESAARLAWDIVRLRQESQDGVSELPDNT